ncbi:MAG: polysaccharide biosynthesis C-terminal domain-containing protein [Flavobacteriales bacterium]|jgi:O-antigen/teichoic acid export membrane protein|nr:polysaccharide biosynthesis C-terminal domain-containing protein [Flavobacteriales bacterium]
MGEIQKQGISNSIILMIGAAIGAFNVMFLFPRILPEAYFGLTRVLVELTYIILQFGLVGGNSAIVRFWSRVPDGSQLFRYVAKYSLLFAGIVLVALMLFKDSIISVYVEKSPLIVEHYNGVYVLFLAGLIFELFAAASTGMLKTQLPIFLKEVAIRVYVTALILVYYFKFIQEDTFIHLFVLGYVLIGLVILFFVVKGKNLLKSTEELVTEKKNEVFKFRIASFFNGFSSGIVNRLDVIMIAALVSSDLVANSGLTFVAIYSIALYTATLIELPSRGLFPISSPIISKFWIQNEMDQITKVYKKSSINLFTIALLLFFLLGLNIDALLSFLKASFIQAKPAMLILGCAKVFNMLLGVNNIILATSKYYLIGTYTMIGLILLTFLLNYWLIPIYGVNGAAIGSLVSLVVYNSVSLFFLWFKFKMQPFSWNTIKVLLLAIIASYLTSFIEIDNVYFSIAIKTMVFSTLYLLPVYLFKISEDINNVVDQTLSKVFKRG